MAQHVLHFSLKALYHLNTNREQKNCNDTALAVSSTVSNATEIFPNTFSAPSNLEFRLMKLKKATIFNTSLAQNYQKNVWPDL